MPKLMTAREMAAKLAAHRQAADESDAEARFHEGPEGKKEFDAWLKKQPKTVQDEWGANTQKYKDRFKTSGQVEDEEKAEAAEERAEADQEKAQAERSEAEADRSDAASKEAGKEKGPGVPDGTGPNPDCPKKDKEASEFSRHRLTWNREAAVSPGGLYGVTKADQRDCEASIRKVQKQAMKIARVISRKDPKVAAFLSTHSKRAKSLPARILVSAIREIQPKVATDVTAVEKDASMGLYGFRAKTATLGLNACSEIRGFTGEVAYGLHSRREARYASITGFFKEHGRQARCDYSRMLLSSYPDPATGKTASLPETVEEWLSWE